MYSLSLYRLGRLKACIDWFPRCQVFRPELHCHVLVGAAGQVTSSLDPAFFCVEKGGNDSLRL